MKILGGVGEGNSNKGYRLPGEGRPRFGEALSAVGKFAQDQSCSQEQGEQFISIAYIIKILIGVSNVHNSSRETHYVSGGSLQEIWEWNLF